MLLIMHIYIYIYIYTSNYKINVYNNRYVFFNIQRKLYIEYNNFFTLYHVYSEQQLYFVYELEIVLFFSIALLYIYIYI